jgi:hypothetical protein
MFVHWYVTSTSASVYREGRVEILRRRAHLGYLMVSFRLSIGQITPPAKVLYGCGKTQERRARLQPCRQVRD